MYETPYNFGSTTYSSCYMRMSGTDTDYTPVYLADMTRNAEERHQNDQDFLGLASELLVKSSTMEEAVAGIRRASGKVTNCISTR